MNNKTPTPQLDKDELLKKFTYLIELQKWTGSEHVSVLPEPVRVFKPEYRENLNLLFTDLEKVIAESNQRAVEAERERIKRCMFPVIDIEAQSSGEQHE